MKTLEEVAKSVQANAHKQWFDNTYDIWMRFGASKDDKKPTLEASPKPEELFPIAGIREGLQSPAGQMLQSLNLEDHIIKFMEHNLLESEPLKYIEDSHLVEMGINFAGDRVRILCACQEPSKTREKGKEEHGGMTL